LRRKEACGTYSDLSFTCGRAGWKKRRRREVETKERTLALTWSVLEDPDKVSKKARGEVTSWKYFKTNGRTFGKICTILLKAEHTIDALKLH
jgi:hypothetical protein